MQRVIILRGCMASGKSTIAKKYRSFDAKVAWIKVDNFKDLFDHFEIETREIIHESAIAVLDHLLAQGFSVVIEGVFQDPIFVQRAVDVAKKHNVAFKVFQTNISLQEIQRRDKIREGVKEGCRQPLADDELKLIYSRIKSNPYPEAINLDTEKLSLEECVRFIDSQFKEL